MELYVTKKVDNGDDFSLAPLDTLPHMHIITPPVSIRRDASGNYYIAEGADTNVVTHLMKLKRLICKQGFKKEATAEDEKTLEKHKLADDIVWVKPSPTMYYKKEGLLIPCNKLLLNFPVQFQISCKSENIYSMGKPYNVYNMFWTIDYVLVDKNFNWDVLAE
jgi:hypothetical protein